MNLRTNWGTNKQKEKEGIWYCLERDVDDDDGVKVEFLLTRANSDVNPKFAKRLEKLGKPYRKRLNLSTSITNQLIKQAFREVCILDWRNVDIGEGPMPFSQENVDKLCRELPDIFAVLVDVASDPSWFQDSVDEDEVKNSSSA